MAAVREARDKRDVRRAMQNTGHAWCRFKGGVPAASAGALVWMGV